MESLKKDLLPDLQKEDIRKELLIQLKKELNSSDLKVIGRHYWFLLPWYQKLFAWLLHLSFFGWVGVFFGYILHSFL